MDISRLSIPAQKIERQTRELIGNLESQADNAIAQSAMAQNTSNELNRDSFLNEVNSKAMKNIFSSLKGSVELTKAA
jgi:hypothetical protein